MHHEQEPRHATLSGPCRAVEAPVRPRRRSTAGSAGALRRLHRASALVLGAFLVVHLSNHVAALGGIEAHRAVMDAARTVYRQPLAEAALLASALVQAGTGLVLGWRGRRRPGRWNRPQALSELSLAVFLLAHVPAILFIRHGLGLETDFHAAAMVLAVASLPIFYAPYYALGVIALFAHAACALRPRLRGPARAWGPRTLLVGGIAAAFVAVGAHAGVFYDVALPAPYRHAAEALAQSFTGGP